MSNLPAPARYVPYHDIGAAPHIVVDGKQQAATTLTLSHWPWNSTPETLLRDTSTDIAFAYLKSPAFHNDSGIVSNSHYDEDGLLSMFALTNPAEAWAHKDWLIRTSYASDFWRCTDEDAAKLSFVLAAWTDPEVSPLPADIFELPLRQKIIAEYRLMLEALPGILSDPYKDEQFWQPEFQFWQDSIAYIDSGEVRLEEWPDLDTVVVRVPGDLPPQRIRRYLTHWELPVHPFAIFAKTNCSRVIWVHGQQVSMQFRYESWVQVSSFKPQPRVDLQPLAELLSELDGTDWQFDGVHEVAAGLYRANEEAGSLAADEVLQALAAFLKDAPPAWDPHGEPPENLAKSGDE